MISPSKRRCCALRRNGSPESRRGFEPEMGKKFPEIGAPEHPGGGSVGSASIWWIATPLPEMKGNMPDAEDCCDVACLHFCSNRRAGGFATGSPSWQVRHPDLERSAAATECGGSEFSVGDRQPSSQHVHQRCRTRIQPANH